MSGTQPASDEKLTTVASDEDRYALDKLWDSPIFELFNITDQNYRREPTEPIPHPFPLPEGEGKVRASHQSTSALSKVSYAKELRTLGQALERLAVQSIDLKFDSGCYVVRGQVDKTKHSPVRVFVRNLAFRLWSVPEEIQPRVSNGFLDVRYTPQQLEQLDTLERAKRRNASKMPDPYGLSQKLRGVGFYLDRRDQCSLLGISIHDRWVTIRYGTVWEELLEAKQDVDYFYNYWVKMYLRRTSRDAPAPKPSGPTYIAADRQFLKDLRF